MRLVIIEHPWKDLPPAIRHTYLKLCIQDCLRRGEAPMASVPVFCMTGALDDLNPEERRQGIAAGLEWYRAADGCVAYTDHGISAGMMQGMAHAQSLGKIVEVRELYPREAETEPQEKP